MVVYFSKNGATKKYATALAKIKNETLFEIKQEKSLGGNISGAIKSVMKKEEKIVEMPNLLDEEVVYLCSPVWAGGFPPAMRYFVNHADLANKEIKLLLVCMSVSNSYVDSYAKQLDEVGVKIAKSVVFSSKKTPEPPLKELSSF